MNDDKMQPAFMNPLERVIGQQQQEIDGMKKIIDSFNQRATLQLERETILFKQLDEILDFKVRPYWKDDQEESFKKYRGLLHEVRMFMLEKYWCFQCADWAFNCECNHD